MCSWEVDIQQFRTVLETETNLLGSCLTDASAPSRTPGHCRLGGRCGLLDSVYLWVDSPGSSVYHWCACAHSRSRQSCAIFSGCGRLRMVSSCASHPYSSSDLRHPRARDQFFTDTGAPTTGSAASHYWIEDPMYGCRIGSKHAMSTRTRHILFVLVMSQLWIFLSDLCHAR
jgi:hypothetical protein